VEPKDVESRDRRREKGGKRGERKGEDKDIRLGGVLLVLNRPRSARKTSLKMAQNHSPKGADEEREKRKGGEKREGRFTHGRRV